MQAVFCLCLRLLLCLSVPGCLCIRLCRCPCVYLTALLSVPLSLPLSLSVTVPAPVSAHAAAAPGDGTYHVLPAPLLCFHWPVWFPPFSTCRRHPECPRRSLESSGALRAPSILHGLWPPSRLSMVLCSLLVARGLDARDSLVAV